MTEAVFWFFAAVAVVTASLCILSRSTLTAVLWLVVTMLSLAAIYVLLNAEYGRDRFVYDLERLQSQTHAVSTLWDPTDPRGE